MAEQTPPAGVQTAPATDGMVHTGERETDWHVITAGPSAGKTATMRELSARGFRTAPEAARMVIDQAVSEGYDPNTVRGAIDFQAQVIAYDRHIETSLDPLTTAFLDRSLADNIAYCRFYGREPPVDLDEVCTGRYETVFLLEQLDFEADYARDEDAEEAQALHEAIRETYEDLGYRPIEVPLMPVDERVDFICEQLGEHHATSPTTYTDEL